jgi:L-arabinose isomerase
MRTRPPKIGLLLLTAEWFSQIGASQGSFASLPLSLRQDSDRITSLLGRDLQVINPGVLATIDQVRQACELFRREQVDAVVINYLTWGEDRTILEAVRLLGDTPFLLWCYSPYVSLPDPLSMPEMLRASGPVGTLQASGPLKRSGKKFALAFGSYEDALALQQIVRFARAAAAVRDLQSARIGVLPYRCDQMSGTYVDEFRLRHEIGPQLKYISTCDYLGICQSVPNEKVEQFVQELKAAHPQAPNLTEKGLTLGARASLGLAETVQRFDLDAIAIEDVGEELHRVVGLRPCLSTPELFERAVVSMEAEVGGAVALLMLRGLISMPAASPLPAASSMPVMYTEVFSYDLSDNALLLGHAGIQDARLAESPEEILLEPDGEYLESEPDSAWMSFRVKGGPVTLLSVFCDVDRFKLVIAQGEAVPGPRRLLGSPHAWVRLQTPLASFFEQCLRTGMTQHWALVHAECVDELLALADILNLEKVVIS